MPPQLTSLAPVVGNLSLMMLPGMLAAPTPNPYP